MKEEYDTFAVKGFKLDNAPASPPPIVLAALRPGMLRLAAREADGAITNWLAPKDVRTVRGELGDEPELIARLFVCPTDDVAEARAIGRWMIAAYMTVPVYKAFHEWLGRGEALRAMNEAWAAGDRKKALEVIPDEVVDDLVVHGSPERCRARVREYVDGGLTTPVLAIVPGGACPRSRRCGRWRRVRTETVRSRLDVYGRGDRGGRADQSREDRDVRS